MQNILVYLKYILSLLLLAAPLKPDVLVGAHALEALIQHPHRDQQPRKVDERQRGLALVSELNSELLGLVQMKTGEAGQNSGDNMSGVDADPQGSTLAVAVE